MKEKRKPIPFRVSFSDLATLPYSKRTKSFICILFRPEIPDQSVLNDVASKGYPTFTDLSRAIEVAQFTLKLGLSVKEGVEDGLILSKTTRPRKVPISRSSFCAEPNHCLLHLGVQHTVF